MTKIQNPKSKTQSPVLLLVPFVLLVLAASAAIAAPAVPGRNKHGRAFSYIYLKKNQWRVPITNYGQFGNDPATGTAGGEWPRGSGHLYIFGAGVWFGRLKKFADHTDTNVTVGYNPNSGKSEYTPGALANAGGGYAGRAFERVYAYPEDWPPDPTKFPAEMQDSFRTALKIPPSGGGDTIFGWFNPIPRVATSSGDCWSVFNDADVTQMETPSVAQSCSIEVYMNTYDWNLPWNQDVVFMQYNVRNLGHDTIKDAYMSMTCDGDIGGAGNDYAGLILHKYIHNTAGTDSIFCNNVGMEWSDAEPGWNTFPGVLAFDFLQSPYKKDSLGRVAGIDGIDNNGNGLIDEPGEGEQIGMTAYKIFTLQAGDPMGDGHQYQALEGKDWWLTPPVYDPFDSLDNAAADKRFLQASGPFTLAPDSMVTLTVGLMAASLSRLPSDRDTSFYNLAITDRAAQQAYDNNWISPVPPPSPNFSLLPGDGRITIMWDNSAEHVADPFYPLSHALKSPFYREFDFQGYKIYRSRTGKTGDWALIAQCDRRDGITFQDSTQADSIRTKATDSGLIYALIDSIGIRYGFPYFYAVTSFDYNTLGSYDSVAHTDTTHLTLESGMIGQAIATRTPPANLKPAQAGVEQTGGNPDVRALIEPTLIATHAVANDTFLIKFGVPAYHTVSGVTNPMPSYNFAVLGMAGETLAPEQDFTIDFLNRRPDSARLAATIFRRVLTKEAYDTTKQLDPRRVFFKVRNSTDLRSTDKTGALLQVEHSITWKDKSSGTAAMGPSGIYILEFPPGDPNIRRHDCVTDRWVDLNTGVVPAVRAIGCDDEYLYKPFGTKIWRFNISDGKPHDSTDIGMTVQDDMFGVANDTVWAGDDQHTFYAFPISSLTGGSVTAAATWDIGSISGDVMSVAWDGLNYFVLAGGQSPSTVRVYDAARATYRDFKVSINATSLLAWANYESYLTLPIVQVSLKIKMDSLPQRVFDSVHVTGNYPGDRLNMSPVYPGGFYAFSWPYRGNSYQLTWKATPTGKLRPEILDLNTNTLLDFRHVVLSPATPESASGWCLFDSLGATPSKARVPTDTITGRRTRALFINGGLIDLNNGRTVAPDSLPAENDVWTVYALRYAPAPILTEYTLTTTAQEYQAVATTLNVKVVPNPYLVRNEWEQHHDFRKLKFINLPNTCTIRIYNLSGDLIRTLKHVETNPATGNIPDQQGGDEDWDLLSAAGQKPAPGVYIFHIESPVGTQIGKFAVVY